jgi:hypothetical protein
MTTPFQLAVVSCGPERPARFHHLTQAAIRGYETLDPDGVANLVSRTDPVFP